MDALIGLLFIQSGETESDIIRGYLAESYCAKK